MKISVLFPDCGYIAKATLKSFEEGTVQVPNINSRQFKRVANYMDYIGQKNVSQYGENTVLIDYINANNVIIGFDDGSQKQGKYRDFINGLLKSDSLISEEIEKRSKKLTKSRVGEEMMSTNSGLMRIIEYNSSIDMTVIFIDKGTKKKTSYRHFKEGRVESDYIKNQREKEIKYREKLIEKQRQNRNKLGEFIILENGMIATITRFNNQHDMEVTIGDEIISTDYSTFKNGMTNWIRIANRQSMVGSIVENKLGTKATIINFNKKDLTFDLKLDNEYKFNRKCYEIEKDEFYTPYDKTVGGVGYLGEKYSPQDYKQINNMWRGLLERTIIQRAKNKKRYEAYQNCSVCDRWLCFSNFVDDMLNIWYDCDERLDLDKDIKYKGNREYSPDKCLLVPHSINMLFSHWKGGEGINHQVGVQYVKSGHHKGTWEVKPCGIYAFDGQFRTGVHKHFKSEIEAGEYYRKIKHEYVRKVLKSYEGRIPDYVMNYCLRFEFEMDDCLVGGSDGCSDVGE